MSFWAAATATFKEWGITWASGLSSDASKSLRLTSDAVPVATRLATTVILAAGALERSHASSRMVSRVPASERSVTATTDRSEEHTSELQSLMRISSAVFCLTKKNHTPTRNNNNDYHLTKTKTQI